MGLALHFELPNILTRTVNLSFMSKHSNANCQEIQPVNSKSLILYSVNCNLFGAPKIIQQLHKQGQRLF